MAQHYFREVSPGTHFPDGHETYFNGINRLAQEWFPEAWHGDDEFRLRNQEYDTGVSRASIVGVRELMSQTLTQAQLAKISDDEIASLLADDRNEQRILELEAPIRYRDMVKKLRGALIGSELSLVALADDGSDQPLPSGYWKSNLAEQVLYDGTCTICDGRFVPNGSVASLPTRCLIFNSEAIDQFIAHRSWRPELSKDEIFSEAVKWLSNEMRKSPSRRPLGMTNAESRAKFNESFDHDIKERAWDKIWKMAIEAEGAQAWSKPGLPKAR